MFKVKNKSIRHCSGVFDVNFEYIWHVVLVLFFVVVVFVVFLFDFEYVNARCNGLFS